MQKLFYAFIMSLCITLPVFSKPHRKNSTLTVRPEETRSVVLEGCGLPFNRWLILANRTSFLEEQIIKRLPAHYKKRYPLGLQFMVWNTTPYVMAEKYSTVFGANSADDTATALSDHKDFFNVRVLLDEQLCDDVHWELSSPTGFIFHDVSNPSRKIVYKVPQCIVKVRNNIIFLNGKPISSNFLRIDPIGSGHSDGSIQSQTRLIAMNGVSNHLGYDGNEYFGSFFIITIGNTVLLINEVELEDYIYCVLRAESWPGWPLEVNKAFAISSRSYLVDKIAEAAVRGRHYHIKNTNIHQTYNGTHTSENLRRAVDETRGLILTYNKQPVLAMFDSCCGGVIPAHIKGVDFKKAPYLARTVECTFCKSCKLYNWQLQLTCNELEKILQEHDINVGVVKDLVVTKSDKAGVVHELKVIGSKGVKLLKGKQLYSFIPKIKSYCYSSQVTGNKILLKGRGYGHHLGICQWGAKKMVDEGWDFRTILNFYYPKTEIMKLKPR